MLRPSIRTLLAAVFALAVLTAGVTFAATEAPETAATPAVAPQQVASDEAPQVAPSQESAPQEVAPDLFMPEAQSLSCTAQQTCSSCNINCGGQSTCTVGATYIECDGEHVDCPGTGSCNPPPGCWHPCGYCQCLGLVQGTPEGCANAVCGKFIP